MKNKMGLKELLVKGAIVGVGTLIGVVASLFVKEDDTPEIGGKDIIEGECEVKDDEVTEVTEE